MKETEASVEVNVPRERAYNQWTQFEEFPRFMKGVESVRQVDDSTLEWRAEIGGKTKAWRAKITEQRPNERILWKSISGTENDGRLEFEKVDGNTTRVRLHLRYDPDGVVENFGDVLKVVDQRVKNDMKNFKEFIESRGRETGGWRGEVEAGNRTR